MFCKANYRQRAQKEASAYLKMTVTYGLIRSKVCSEIAQSILELKVEDQDRMLAILQQYMLDDGPARSLRGCHRDFYDKMKKIYHEIQYQQDRPASDGFNTLSSWWKAYNLPYHKAHQAKIRSGLAS